MKLEYRTASLNDLEEIWNLVRNAVSTMIQQNIFQWDAVYPNEDAFRKDIEKGQLTVGTIDKQIAVVYVLNQECEEEYKNGKWKYENEPFCVVHRLCVNPIFQDRGVGRAVMLHMEKAAAAMGFRSIRLDAFTGNPFALKLYDKLGYERVGYADWRKGRFYLLEKYI